VQTLQKVLFIFSLVVGLAVVLGTVVDVVVDGDGNQSADEWLRFNKRGSELEHPDVTARGEGLIFVCWGYHHGLFIATGKMEEE